MSPGAAIRVLLADDHKDLRDALALLIERTDGLELAAVASDAAEAVELAGSERPDVALIDVRMPAGGGIAASRGITACSPNTAIVAMSAFGAVPELSETEVVAYVRKGSPNREIVDAIKRAAGQPRAGRSAL